MKPASQYLTSRGSKDSRQTGSAPGSATKSLEECLKRIATARNFPLKPTVPLNVHQPWKTRTALRRGN
jgi:hypothetical protein